MLSPLAGFFPGVLVSYHGVHTPSYVLSPLAGFWGQTFFQLCAMLFYSKSV